MLGSITDLFYFCKTEKMEQPLVGNQGTVMSDLLSSFSSLFPQMFTEQLFLF